MDPATTHLPGIKVLVRFLSMIINKCNFPFFFSSSFSDWLKSLASAFCTPACTCTTTTTCHEDQSTHALWQQFFICCRGIGDFPFAPGLPLCTPGDDITISISPLEALSLGGVVRSEQPDLYPMGTGMAPPKFWTLALPYHSLSLASP